MMRVVLFLATNIAVIVIASLTLNLLGVGSYLEQNNASLDIGSLLIFCAVFGMAGAFVSLFLSKFMAKMTAKVKVIENPQSQREQWLLQTVEHLAAKAGIGMPEVGIFPARESNAFATGWNKNKALVAVSEGLLGNMGQQEVEAVLAHEVAHIANGDMITMTLIQGVVNTFVMFLARIVGSVIDRVVLKNENGHGLGYFAVVFICEMVFAVLASTIVMWFSRHREYRADEGGASLTSRQAMVSALRALQRETSQQLEELPEALHAFGISASQRSGIKKLFASHPPLSERIAALEAAQF